MRCAAADDILRALEFARTSNLPLAVRSGGHSQAGHGSCDDGIVVDLGGMRGIEIDPARRVARVASGARVRDVMDATQRYGLTTPMGGCPDVGVGGLTLGGGENFLMAKYGAVVDNVIGAEIITADGMLRMVSETEHPDLFWAIRGGGGNFGVVTSFSYRLYDVGDVVLAGQFTFPLSHAAETMRAYRELMETAPDEFSTSGGLTTVPDGPAFFIAVCYCGERKAGERMIGAWRSALRPVEDTVKWGPYSSELTVPPAASVGTGVFLRELNDDVIDRFAMAISAAPLSANAVWNDFHGAVTRVPPEAMAFPLRHRGFDLFISVPWETEQDRRQAVDWVDRLARELRPFGRGVYVNNLNENEDNRVREAFGVNYDRLVQIKGRYDPTNVWRVNHNVAPY